MLNLSKKVCLITGCNGYLGKSICQLFKKLGATVIGIDIVNKKNDNLDNFFKVDLNNKNQIDSLIKNLKKVKKIDVLVNNAAFLANSKINNTKEKKLFYNHKYENLNLTNTIYLTNCVIPFLRKSKNGSVINICSIYASLAYDYNLYKNTNMKPPLAYGVSKAGLKHYSKMLASIVSPKIRVNSISPGGILRGQPKKFISKYLSKTPISRMAKEKDISNVVAFFASDYSIYITGQDLIVDGGYSIS